MSEPILLIDTLAPHHAATPRGPINGGWILAQIDKAAGVAGPLLTGGEALILRLSELTFRAPLYSDERFALTARVSRSGRTSLGLQLLGVADPEGDSRTILDAEMLLVAIDSDGKPRGWATA